MKKPFAHSCYYFHFAGQWASMDSLSRNVDWREQSLVNPYIESLTSKEGM